MYDIEIHTLCLPVLMYLNKMKCIYKKHFAVKVFFCGVKLYSMMAKGHWGIADIKNDIDAMEVLLQARPSLMGNNLQNSLKDKVKMMNLNGPAELAQVYQMLQQSKTT